MSSTAHGAEPYYFVPEPSKWPMIGSIAMTLFGFGMVGWMNEAAWGPYVLYAFFAVLIYMFFGWFGVVARESESGKYNERVDTSFRWSMSWFIFSEVMFFAAFFGALWYARVITMPWLGDLDHKALLWPDFAASWPNVGPAQVVEGFETMGPFWLPTINTILLLTSGLTLTIAHHALKDDARGKTMFWLAMTVLLGAAFMCVQGYEYYHAYTDLNLKLNSGIFGSTFFMLTGFHGFHVTIGAIMLTVVLFRIARGHFNSTNHFAFEAAAWYWHFVDVVWLGLYVVVYWL
ncbi:MAG: cytochrome c oxidase subunit 3 [Burkholderiaceae bacterium]